MLAVKLLGQFNIQLDDQPIEIPSRPAQTLFAYLALHPGTAFRREMLAGLVWPEANEANARSNLRHALWRIRKALGEQVGQNYFPADDLTLAFSPDPGCWIDAVLVGGKIDAGPTPRTLEEQVAAYQGELLPGFYDDWITIEREHLQSAFESKIETLIDRLCGEKHWPDVIEWAEHWIKFGTAPEPAYRALMTAHARSGHKAKAKEAYQRCIEALQREFGVEPSEETQALYQQLTTTRPLSGTIVAPTFAAPRNNLPTPATPLIGRESELAEITQRLVNDPDCRLLTLVGPGGIGKSRLALQAAAQLLEYFADGTFFVSFEAITAAAAFAPTILQTLSSAIQDQKDPHAQLIDYVHDKQLLLILDNLEHLLEGAALIGEVLAAAPAIKIIVTSRERLHLQWEWLYEVQGLSYPRESAEAVENYSAVQLFLQTAQRMRAHFSLADEQAHVIRICQLVEGMPLGIEMAASWVRVLTCRDIVQQIERNLDMLAQKLSDVPTRHLSVRAAFEYSWNLLAPEEQAAFVQLAVFPGGFRREAAEKVARAPLSSLFSLVDKSLLRVSATGRYDMHRLLHQYVSEKLVQSSRGADVQTRLLNYYLDYARQSQHDYAALEEERINLMACMEVAHHNWQAQIVLDYAEALSEALFARGRFSDARQVFEWACEAAQAHDDDQKLAKYLRQWGEACIEQGDYEEAEQRLQSCMQLINRADDRQAVADTQYHLARVAIFRSDYAKAKQLLLDSHCIFDQLQDMVGLAQTFHQQARLWYYTSNFIEAESTARQALELWRQHDAPSRCIRTLNLLADIALHGMQKLAEAESYCQQALTLCEQLQDQSNKTTLLYTLAEVYRRQGRLREARAEADTSLILAKQIGDRKSQAHAYFRLSEIDGDAKNYAPALNEAQRSFRLCLDLQDLWGAVYVQAHIGDLHAALQQFEPARTHWAEALTRAESLHHPIVAELRKRLDRSDSP